VANDDERADGPAERMARTELREVFRFQKGNDLRVYGLRLVSGRVELWRVTETPGQQASAIKEADCANSREALELFEDIEASLKAGGWRETAPDGR
jgi:hypothetical protein